MPWPLFTSPLDVPSTPDLLAMSASESTPVAPPLLAEALDVIPAQMDEGAGQSPVLPANLEPVPPPPALEALEADPAEVVEPSAPSALETEPHPPAVEPPETGAAAVADDPPIASAALETIPPAPAVKLSVTATPATVDEGTVQLPVQSAPVPPPPAVRASKGASVEMDQLPVLGSDLEKGSSESGADDKGSDERSVVGKDADEKGRYLVDTFEDSESPKHLPKGKKWAVVGVIALGSMFATAASSIHAFAELGVMEAYGVSEEVSILGISLFVFGMGIGPLFVGPLSELYGRRIIYLISYLLFFAFSFPVAFAPDVGTFMAFRLLTGMCGSTFLSVALGSISDMFVNEEVGPPLALYTLTPFLGPSLGPLLSGFINQRTSWRWTYRTVIIMTFIELVLLYFLVPETYEPVLLKRKAERLRKTTGDAQYYALLDRAHPDLIRAIAFSCYKPFELLFFEPMCLLLGIQAALVYAIMYLAFEAFPLIYRKHLFTEEHIGVTFLGFGLGMIFGFLALPFLNRRIERRTREAGGNPPPEVRLLICQPGGVAAAVGLLWIAFTSYAHVHWILPVLGSVIFGAGVYLTFLGSASYLVIVYRTYAASTMAGNAFMRGCLAAGFPLFAGQMYAKLGTVGATALLAGLATIMIPLPFIFFKIGGRIRATSRNAEKGLPGW